MRKNIGWYRIKYYLRVKYYTLNKINKTKLTKTMKNLSLLLLSTLMAVCVFTSCSDDDDDKIIGVWKFEVSEITELKLAEEDNTPEIINLFKEEFSDDYENSIVEFKKDGVIIDSEGYAGKYWFNGNKLFTQYTYDGEEETTSIEYAFDGKKTLFLYDTYDVEDAYVYIPGKGAIYAEKLTVRQKLVKQ